ncbi:MAG: 1-deoxy-D-xylulose-5-phosphate reductoisomerase [Proteobacteria bacterium]|nr:1-deoxy-D-xylulose-5-phosphate reductoisomerase [Pseudomonadota bacterium]
MGARAGVFKKGIVILGSTGSIGVSSLDVLDRHPERFEVVGLTGWGNVDTLKAQILRHRPKIVAVADEEKAAQLRSDAELKGTDVVWGTEGLLEVATVNGADMVVSAIVGSAGLVPTFAAIQAGRDIALANKETLVAAGQIVMDEVRRRGVRLLPVDSEHSAIFQSLAGHNSKDVKRLILTASGGPFRGKSKAQLSSVRVQDALNHPTWSMGSKITIDSATLMNKGLEVIEARWLFDMPGDRIDVVVHPQSIVHSMVEYIDSSVVSQMGVPDMKGAIAYALSYPDRIETGLPFLDLASVSTLTFESPDREAFPSLGLCYRAIEMGGAAPAVLSAANEVAVNAFLDEKIGFCSMATVMEAVLDNYSATEPSSIADVLKADLWGRHAARKEMESLTEKVEYK